MSHKRLGEVLLEHKIITTTQLEQALVHQRQTGSRLGAALVAQGVLTEAQLCSSLGKAIGVRSVAMPPGQADPEALRLLRARFCEANDVFPLSVGHTAGRKTLMVVMADPLNVPAIEEMEYTTGMLVIPMIGPLSGIRAAIRLHYLAPQPGSRPAPTATSSGRPAPARGGEGNAASTSTSETLVGGGPNGSAPHAATSPEGRPAKRSGESGGWTEKTERTALADLIRARAGKRRGKNAEGEGQESLEGLAKMFGISAADPAHRIEQLESRFWALLRVMAKKGLLTRDDFLREIDRAE